MQQIKAIQAQDPLKPESPGEGENPRPNLALLLRADTLSVCSWFV
jgi:hypothetical protein